MSDEQQIRELIATWMRASMAEDLDGVLNLMTEDAVFLLPGRPPIKGREAFAAISRAGQGKFRLDGKSEIQEIQISGDYAFCWNNLSLTITPLPTGAPMQREGPVLTVFRKDPDGQWRLFRDANLLTAV